MLNIFFGPFLFWAWVLIGFPAISAAPDLALPPANDDGYAHMGLAQWTWYQYLSLDQQIVMMFWGMQFTTAFEDWNVRDTFNYYSFANWHGKDLEQRLADYTLFEIYIGLINTAIWSVILFVMYFIYIGPFLYEFCQPYNNTYYVDWLGGFNICRLNWQEVFGTTRNYRPRGGRSRRG